MGIEEKKEYFDRITLRSGEPSGSEDRMEAGLRGTGWSKKSK